MPREASPIPSSFRLGSGIRPLEQMAGPDPKESLGAKISKVGDAQYSHVTVHFGG